MLILSNGLSEVVDEGFLKVANSLVKRIKKTDPDVTVVSYDRRSEITDHYLELNKLLLNHSLISIIKKCRTTVLYIPFPAKPISTAIGIFMLSLFQRKKLNVMLVMKDSMNLPAKLLLRMSGADLIVLSRESEKFYSEFIPQKRIKYIKTGVDTKRFVQIEPAKAVKLKEKYGFDPSKPLVLHVGHLNRGRNVSELMKISDKYNVLLVTSTLTKDEQDSALKNELLSRPNIRIIDEYIPNIEEIYQMSDVYFFPTMVKCNCIDVPLSCLEAAACGKKVITTRYGEMNEFVGKQGFYFIDQMDGGTINELIDKALSETQCDTRASVLQYDWDNAIDDLQKL